MITPFARFIIQSFHMMHESLYKYYVSTYGWDSYFLFLFPLFIIKLKFCSFGSKTIWQKCSQACNLNNVVFVSDQVDWYFRIEFTQELTASTTRTTKLAFKVSSNSNGAEFFISLKGHRKQMLHKGKTISANIFYMKWYINFLEE